MAWEGAVMDIVGDTSTGLERRFCSSCGAAFVGAPKFCPNCGAERLHPALAPTPSRARTTAEPAATEAPAPPQRRRRWGLIIALVSASLAVVMLAGWVVSLNGRLGDTTDTLVAEQARGRQLTAKIASLSSDVKRLRNDKSALNRDNYALKTAAEDCRDAAIKMRGFIRLAGLLYVGKASVSDAKIAWRTAQSAMQQCQTEALSNGAF
jgi:hypothetical protein